MIEAHLLTGDFNALAGEEGEEHVLDAFCRILPERFVQDPRIIGVDVSCQRFLLIRAGYFFVRNRVHHALERFHISGVALPSGIVDSRSSDIFGEEPVVSLHRAVRFLRQAGGDGCNADRCGR